MQIKSLKLANSVKCGTAEHLFLQDDYFEMRLENSIIVKMKERKTGAEAYTTLMNVCWWHEKPEEPKAKGK